MMLSESQERMLMVLRPEKEAEAEAIFRKWGLDFAIVGNTTDDLRFRVLHQGEEVANLPIKDLGDQAPEYDRPWIEPKKPAPLAADDIPQADVADALLKLLGGPDLSSRRWVYEQYDTLIQGNSLQRPGGDAGVVRVEGHPTKALAFSSDVTPRYCEADPYEGGKQAVAECWRNLTATGAEPLAATDNLNFGNPERPEIMGQLVACRSKASARPAARSTSRSSRATSRSTTRPTAAASCRRPTIGGVGLIADWAEDGAHRLCRARAKRSCWSARPPAGARISASRSICATSTAARDGPPPPVDLAHEKQRRRFRPQR